jgi:hypothetical protein
MWNDRARCGNLQRSINAAGTQVGNTGANEYNNNEKEVLNDPFGSTRPAQRASQLGGLEKDYPPWTMTGADYAQGSRITYNGKCYVAAAAGGVPRKISPSNNPGLAGDVAQTTTFWTEVRCPHHTAVDYITAPDDVNVLRPDFTCRLPAVFWARHAAKRFDSPIHDSFRFKVRGCFLHEAAYYSASGEQRTCKAKGKDVAATYAAHDEPKEGLGYAKRSLGAGLGLAVPASNVEDQGQTVVALADLTLKARTDSGYFAAQDFDNYQRAALLSYLHSAAGLNLTPHSVIIEQVEQKDIHGVVKLAFIVHGSARAGQIITDLNANNAKFNEGLVAAVNAAAGAVAGSATGQFGKRMVGSVSFSKARDILSYGSDVVKDVLSTSVNLAGVDASRVIGSSAFRTAFSTTIAKIVGVAPAAVQISAVSEAKVEGRRLGAAARKLAETTGTTVKFTVITDPTSKVTVNSAASQIQAAVNDNTLVKMVNAETGMAFDSAVMGTVGASSTGSGSSTIVGGIDYSAWATAATVIMCILVIIILILLFMVCGKGGGKGSPQASAGDMELSNQGVAASQAVGSAVAMNSNPIRDPNARVTHETKAR